MTFLVWPAFMTGSPSVFGSQVAAPTAEAAVQTWHRQHPKASPGGRPIDVIVRDLDNTHEPDATYATEVTYTARRK